MIGSSFSALASVGGLRDRLKLRRRVESRFEVDSRSLAIVRVSLGLILLTDLIHRSGYIGMFYTDAGVYPLTAFENTYTRYNSISLHAASGELWLQQLLFFLAGVFAVLFIIGYRTRLIGFISLGLLLSLHGRNPAVLNGGDRMLRVFLFVALLAPLGERWSIDALRRDSARPKVVSFGTAAVLIQPIVIFTSNAVQKHAGEKWYAGDALQIALSNDVMTVYLGDVLVEYPNLLTVLNYGWLVLIGGSAVFLLLPVGRVRALVALGYMSAFLGMSVTMTVGLFPAVLIASVTPFLTTPFWDTLTRIAPSRLPCLPDNSQLGALGSRPLEHRVLDGLDERGHEFVASYVVAFGKSAVTVFGFLAIVWMISFSAADTTDYDLPDELDYSHLDQQSWGLYAPDPSKSYSWYPVGAELENGTEVDAFEGGEVDFDRPPDAATEYETFRHRKFMQKVEDSGEEENSDYIAQGYSEWTCRRATEKHGDVEKITVYEMYQSSPVDGDFEEPVKFTVIEHGCG